MQIVSKKHDDNIMSITTTNNNNKQQQEWGEMSAVSLEFTEKWLQAGLFKAQLMKRQQYFWYYASCFCWAVMAWLQRNLSSWIRICNYLNAIHPVRKIR